MKFCNKIVFKLLSILGLVALQVSAQGGCIYCDDELLMETVIEFKGSATKYSIADDGLFWYNDMTMTAEELNEMADQRESWEEQFCACLRDENPELDSDNDFVVFHGKATEHGTFGEMQKEDYMAVCPPTDDGEKEKTVPELIHKEEHSCTCADDNAKHRFKIGSSYTCILTINEWSPEDAEE